MCENQLILISDPDEISAESDGFQISLKHNKSNARGKYRADDRDHFSANK